MIPVIQPLRFGIVGIVNTALGLGAIFAAKSLLGLGDLPANIVGYAVGLLASFTLNRRWTFRHTGSPVPAAVRFSVAFAVSYTLNLVTVLALIEGLQINAYIAQAAGVIPYTIVFYLLSARLVFASHSRY